jgi:hypothetical protein
MTCRQATVPRAPLRHAVESVALSARAVRREAVVYRPVCAIEAGAFAQ